MQSILLTVQAVLGVILSLMILLQNRASGLSQTFGGSGAITVQRRGAERLLYRGTVLVSVVFFSLTFVGWYDIPYM